MFQTLKIMNYEEYPHNYFRGNGRKSHIAPVWSVNNAPDTPMSLIVKDEINKERQHFSTSTNEIMLGLV